MREIGQPFLLLRSDVSGRGDPERRIDEEEDEDLAVAGFLWVCESEGLDLVLVEVWEGDAAIGFGDHVSDCLYAWYAPAMNVTLVQFRFWDWVGCRTCPCHTEPAYRCCRLAREPKVPTLPS